MGREAVARAGSWAQSLDRWVARVEERIAPEAITLCGSYARGMFIDELSDVDVLVVGGRLPDRMYDRFDVLTALARDLALPIEAIAYTRTEFERLIVKGHVGVYDALAFGIPLWGDEVWGNWRQQFHELEQLGLRRGQHRWQMPQVDQGPGSS